MLSTVHLHGSDNLIRTCMKMVHRGFLPWKLKIETGISVRLNHQNYGVGIIETELRRDLRDFLQTITSLIPKVLTGAIILVVLLAHWNGYFS